MGERPAAAVRVMLTVLALVLLAVAGYLALACGSQRAVLFPRHLAVAPPGADRVPGLEKLRIGRSADVEAWYLPPTRRAAERGPALVFTHGNAELIDHWAGAFQVPRDWGVAVLLVEYPGYGRSGGRPSQRSITDAVVSGYDRLAERPEVDPARIVAYGRSVGGGAACALAEERDVAALILESTFTSVRDMARTLGLPGFLSSLVVRDPFDNLDVLRHFAGPSLIIHGARDAIVPVAHGRRLDAAARDSTLHLLGCGHNDCPRPWAAVERFLTEHAILTR